MRGEANDLVIVRDLTRHVGRTGRFSNMSALASRFLGERQDVRHNREAVILHVRLGMQLGLFDRNGLLTPGYALCDAGMYGGDRSLTQTESALLFALIAERDPVFLDLARLLAERGEVARMEAMIYAVEDAMPRLLGIDTSELAQQRRSMQAKDWIRTPSYVPYRHLAPPRLEWLVDLGLAERDRSGGRDVIYRATGKLHGMRDLLGQDVRLGDVLYTRLPQFFFVPVPYGHGRLKTVILRALSFMRKRRTAAHFRDIMLASWRFLVAHGMVVDEEELMFEMDGLLLEGILTIAGNDDQGMRLTILRV